MKRNFMNQNKIKKIPKIEQDILNSFKNRFTIESGHVTEISNLPYSNQKERLQLPQSYYDSHPEIKNYFKKMETRKITSLPDSIDALKYVKKIKITNNFLTSLPESFENLQNLQNLDLSSNQLTILPESFGKLQNLLRSN